MVNGDISDKHFDNQASVEKHSLAIIVAVLIGVSILYLSLVFFSEQISFGSDRDASLVAYSARLLASHQPYEPSRLPGAPLFERLMSLFVSSSDARPAKAIVALCSIAVVGLFIVIGILSGGDRRVVPFVGLLFSVFPIFMKTSIIVMDYSLSLLMILSSALLLSICSLMKMHRSFVISLAAGFMLALAIGARLSALLFLPAAALSVLFDARRSMRLRIVVLTGFIISTSFATIIYRPIFNLYGTHFLSGFFARIPVFLLAKLQIVQFISLAGGLLGVIVVAVLVFFVLRNIRGQVAADLWKKQEWGVRAFFLFSLFNTLFYLRYPDELAYNLPLLLGGALFLAIGLQPRQQPFIWIAILILALSSTVELVPGRQKGFSVKSGIVLTELIQQKKDRGLHEQLFSIVNDTQKHVLVLGYPATDRALVWFFGRIRVLDRLPHPNCRTMWGAPTFYPDPVYQGGGSLWADPALLLSDRNKDRLARLLESKGIRELLLVRSPLEEPLDPPADLCRSRVCTELDY